MWDGEGGIHSNIIIPSCLKRNATQSYHFPVVLYSSYHEILNISFRQQWFDSNLLNIIATFYSCQAPGKEIPLVLNNLCN